MTSPVPTRAVRLVAVVAGIVGILGCLLTPLLPVKGSDPSFDWPRSQQPLASTTSSVTAPLIAQTPRSLDATIGCRVLADLPAHVTTVLSTMPAGAKDATSSSLRIIATESTVSVVFRNSVAATAARADLGRCSVLRVFSRASGPGAQFVGLGAATTLDPVKRPRVAGIFSDLTAREARADADRGMHVRLDVDNRYATSPTALKLTVMILSVLSVAVSLLALLLLDRATDRPGTVRRRAVRRGRARRLGELDVPGRRLRRPWAADGVVAGVLVAWLVLGVGGPDDGYILNMGRTASSFGYLSNYYRFFGIPEAPFDWYYSLLGPWSAVSDSLLWMHLIPMAIGIASWLVLSRALLPRLGAALRTRRNWPMWAAAAVFLAFWLPFCSGLRSESVIVLGSLLTWWAAESAIGSRRLVPAALAAVTAGFTLAAAPQGVIGVAILLVSARPLLRILAARRADTGTAPLVAPILAAGAVVLVVVFRDQTLASVYDAVATRYHVGPVIDWYQEYLRYYFVSVRTDDGALTRRVPLLLLLAGTIVTAAVMLRRTVIGGLRPGPVWRLIGGVGVTLLLFIATPTKWTIHFGVFAGLGAAIAATATVAVATAAARSARNLTVFCSALLFAVAAATAGRNAWPYVDDYGIAWFDRAPVIGGQQVSSVLLALALLTAAVAVWQHLRVDHVRNDRIRLERTGRGRADGLRRVANRAPTAIVAGVLVIAEVLVFVKATAVRPPAPTASGEVIAEIQRRSCGLADKILAEPDPNAGMLVSADGRSATDALRGAHPIGFSTNGIPGDLSPKPGTGQPGQMNVATAVTHAFNISGGPSAGTTGGQGPRTVNGSTAALPFGLDPARTPVLGSAGYGGEATLMTDWYRLPPASASPLLTFATAGAVSTIDMFGIHSFGQEVLAQFGRPGPDGGFTQVGPDVVPFDPGPTLPNQPWRNLRVPRSQAPSDATVMRLSLRDNNVGATQFIAITPPRAPRLQTLQRLVGSAAPTLIDFTVGAHFPCQQPMQISDGVAEIPRWRILPDYNKANAQSKTWQNAADGGLLAISESTTSAHTVPTYLADDWHRSWGALEQLTPLDPDAPPAAATTTEQTRWGWSRTGSIRLDPSHDE